MTDLQHDGKAAALFRDALVWDDHAGFEFSAALDLDRLWRWKAAGVDYLSINAGYDVMPWTFSIAALAAYRHFIAAHPERYLLAGRASDVIRAKTEGKLALAFDMEGMCCLNEDPAMVQFYYDNGVRQMNFAYNINNAAGGGCHDEDIGLTDFGRAVVGEMNRVGMLVDCSHNSYRTSLEAMELSSAPVIFSHSNARALCDHERNIRDEQIKACAATGGVVGINGIHWFLDRENPGVEAMVRHVDYMVNLIGPAHLGIGLDYVFDDDSLLNTHAVKAEFWPKRQYGKRSGRGYLPPEILLELAERLLALGYGEADLRAILGLNFLRVAEAVWK